MTTKNLGICLLLVVVFVLTAGLSDNFLDAYNLRNLIQRASLYGLIGVGVSFVIITGGIDLSIGSVIGLVASIMPLMMVTHQVPAAVALLVVLLLSLAIGVIHAFLIAIVRLQPFVVTLCGLMIYRGLARWLTGDNSPGMGQFKALRQLSVYRFPVGQMTGLGDFELPVTLLILVVVAGLAAGFLNLTVYGRYLLAVGRNEQAARFTGINTKAMIFVAYIACSLITGLAGVLFVLDTPAVQPDSYGNFYELYAIAAAVLGGCSLRGGEGSILGVLIGAAILQLLFNAIGILGIPSTMEFAIAGIVILAGALADEVMRSWLARRRLAKVKNS
ncbi:MAG: ABC transporter permease [Pirellulaceae bacterium]|nr:ABC transporter permease [Pirellulaceae bacterium]